jgi:hypothetical protein
MSAARGTAGRLARPLGSLDHIRPRHDPLGPGVAIAYRSIGRTFTQTPASLHVFGGAGPQGHLDTGQPPVCQAPEGAKNRIGQR